MRRKFSTIVEKISPLRLAKGKPTVEMTMEKIKNFVR